VNIQAVFCYFLGKSVFCPKTWYFVLYVMVFTGFACNLEMSGQDKKLKIGVYVDLDAPTS